MTNILCKCGHPENVHPPTTYMQVTEIAGWSVAYWACNDCFINNRVDGVLQLGRIDCKVYTPDNLVHIEVLAKQKGLV